MQKPIARDMEITFNGKFTITCKAVGLDVTIPVVELNRALGDAGLEVSYKEIGIQQTPKAKP